MWEFKKHGESIVLDNGRIHTNLNYILEKDEDAVVVEIPSLKVLFETRQSAITDIQNRATTTLESYFKYWIPSKDLRALSTTCFKLGFKLQKFSSMEDRNMKSKKITAKKLHLDLSY